MIEVDCRKCIHCNGNECFAYHTNKPDVATKKCANDNFRNYIAEENATVEFNGFTQGVIGKKLYADSVLKKMQKSELIELLHLAQHNYNTLMLFYTNAVNVNMDKLKEREQEIRDEAIDTFLMTIETLVKLHGAASVSEIQEIAEQMKEVGE